MADVYFRKTAYDDPNLKQIVFDMMDTLGGRSISSGNKVIIKPNFLLAAGPDKGIISHPRILRFVSEYVIDRGCRPFISDSPPIGSFEKILSKGGVIAELSGLDVAFRSFRESAEIDIGDPFGVVEIAKEALDADVVINLAKLKTHAQMMLTLGVKNMFGCVVGLKKPEWHFRAGVDREMFARLLVQICQAVGPAITVIDGILALEGHGPGKSGTPKELGLLVGSRSAIAADMAITSVLGLESGALPTNRAAGDLGLVPADIHIHGEFDIVGDFNFPEMTSMAIGPERLHGFMRRHVLQKPVSDNRKCKLCSECWRYCPVKAIRHNVKGIRFNYNACIRCYCCLEICPFGAITIKKPLLGRCLKI